MWTGFTGHQNLTDSSSSTHLHLTMHSIFSTNISISTNNYTSPPPLPSRPLLSHPSATLDSSAATLHRGRSQRWARQTSCNHLIARTAGHRATTRRASHRLRSDRLRARSINHTIIRRLGDHTRVRAGVRGGARARHLRCHRDRSGVADRDGGQGVCGVVCDGREGQGGCVCDGCGRDGEGGGVGDGAGGEGHVDGGRLVDDGGDVGAGGGWSEDGGGAGGGGGLDGDEGDEGCKGGVERGETEGDSLGVRVGLGFCFGVDDAGGLYNVNYKPTSFLPL